MKKLFLTFLIFGLVIAIFPLPANAQVASIVPCGNSVYREPCTFTHFLILIVRLTNYLISVAGLVALYQLLLRGWDLIISMGNPEKIKAQKEGIGQVLAGLGMIVLAFVFVNLLVNGIFGATPIDQSQTRQWWNPKCLYDITDIDGCPLDPSQQ